MEIIPSILTADPDEAHALVVVCEEVTARAHIDIIDSRFADNKTVTPDVFSEEIYRVNLDFHLMVSEPEKWVRSCVRANAERIIGQVELMEDQRSFCDTVNREGILCGLALDLPTGVESLDESVLSLLDVILVMSVPAGFGGQPFDPKALEKLSFLSQLREEKGYRYKLCDDGGVSFENQSRIAQVGCDELVIGRRLFEGNLAENIETWKKVISRYNEQ